MVMAATAGEVSADQSIERGPIQERFVQSQLDPVHLKCASSSAFACHGLDGPV